MTWDSSGSRKNNHRNPVRVELQRDCHKKDVGCRKACSLENFFIWAMALVLGAGLSQGKGQGQGFGKGESRSGSGASKGLPKEGIGCK